MIATKRECGELNAEQEREVQRWAATDTWQTPEQIEFALRVFARVILAALVTSEGGVHDRM